MIARAANGIIAPTSMSGGGRGEMRSSSVLMGKYNSDGGTFSAGGGTFSSDGGGSFSSDGGGTFSSNSGGWGSNVMVRVFAIAKVFVNASVLG